MPNSVLAGAAGSSTKVMVSEAWVSLGLDRPLQNCYCAMIYHRLWYQGVPELELGLLLLNEHDCVTRGKVGLMM